MNIQKTFKNICKLGHKHKKIGGNAGFSLSDNSHPIRPSVLMFFLFKMFHLSFFQIYPHSYLAYLIGDISQGTCI